MCDHDQNGDVGGDDDDVDDDDDDDDDDVNDIIMFETGLCGGSLSCKGVLRFEDERNKGDIIITSSSLYS